MTIARITTKGQVTIPAQVRKTLGLEEGDALVFEVTNQDEARIRIIKRLTTKVQDAQTKERRR